MSSMRKFECLFVRTLHIPDISNTLQPGSSPLFPRYRLSTRVVRRALYSSISNDSYMRKAAIASIAPQSPFLVPSPPSLRARGHSFFPFSPELPFKEMKDSNSYLHRCHEGSRRLSSVINSVGSAAERPAFNYCAQRTGDYGGI